MAPKVDALQEDVQNGIVQGRQQHSQTHAAQIIVRQFPNNHTIEEVRGRPTQQLQGHPKG